MTHRIEPSLLRRVRIPLTIYFVVLAGYLAASGRRLKGHTSDNHYVYLAQSFLAGRLSLKGRPPHQNDFAMVEELTLKDGRRLRGTFLKTGGKDRFETTGGERMVIPPDQIRTRRQVYYVSFPWFPAILMLPFVAIFGLRFNDVLFNVLLAPFNAVLVYLILRRLVQLRYSERSLSDDLWLTGLFAFGTVHFYASVIGQVWYTAHIVGVGLTALYVLAALEGRHPIAAGLCLGLGFITRTPIPFSFPLVVGEVLRRNLAPSNGPVATDRTLWQKIREASARLALPVAARQLSLAALPALGVASVACVLNYLRFDDPFEFGHYYLNVRWTERIQRWGLFNYHFISRNLAAMLTLLPRFMTRPPYVRVSYHGLSLFVTTPIFAYLFCPKRRSPLYPWLYLSCLFPAVLHLLYQHTGWLQFGYRFSLDYTVYLIALLSIGGRRLGWMAKSLILFGVGVNTFGAVTFSTGSRFYWDGMFPVQ